jgi:glycosyltransferase involved in cell wall biosynthesis
MRILLVRRGPITVIDGISTYMLELAEALMSRGLKVWILSGSTSMSDGEVKHFIKENFHVERLPEIYDWGRVGYIPDRWSTRKLFYIAKDLGVDIIHAQGLIPLLRFGERAGYTFVATHHGAIEWYISPSLKRKIVYPLYLLLGSKPYSTIVAVSKKLKNELSRLNPLLRRKTIVIPPGINVERVRRFAKKSSSRENLIVHVGTRYEKNPLTSLLAFKYAIRKGLLPSDAKLVLIGSPSRWSNLDGLLQSLRGRIEIYESLSWQKLIELLGGAKALIAPSVYEAFPILSLEAMALGTPIIASSAIPSEAVTDGLTGFVVDNCYDYVSFAKYIARLLNDEELWQRLHVNCLRRAELFDSKRVAEQVLKVYRTLHEV